MTGARVRYVGVDLGDARTGLALGDAQTRLATPLTVVEVGVRVRDGAALLEALSREIERQAGRGEGVVLVVGLPINMDGTEGPRARVSRGLGARLAEALGCRVEFFDERLTSAAAEWRLAGSGLTRGQKKSRRDAIAACAILEGFFASSLPGGQDE